MDIFQKCFDYDRPEKVKAMGLYPYFVPLQGHVGAEMEIGGHSLIMLGSNNYLGLTDNPYVMEKSREAITKYGTGCTGSRFLNGTLDIHLELEERLTKFLKKEACLTYSTGFQANLGTIGTLGARGDIIYLDRKNHASIIDGARMSYGEVVKYRHNDLEHLRDILEKHTGEPGMIITDGVFSMEGDLAKINGLADLAEEFGVRLLVDDAHGVGAMGATGMGTAEHLGCHDRVDVLIGTFSKSFACIGGFAAGPAGVISYLRHNARTNIFSASLPPAAVATVIAALDIIEKEPELLTKVHHAAERCRNGLADLGFNIGHSEAPIIPVFIGEDLDCFRVWKDMFDNGVFTNPVISPAVEPGGAMLRTSYMASHTDDMIDRALDVFEKVGRKHHLIG
ncbi:MAG: pyridoxal phosphate-dependent aminotransferase family protein [Candidatus Fermentibacteraceae bacterium]|nr:pyridoxal phosphate-dependent aminotransferase family protein [Candidatus Fermentibacteraceae bacterium]